MLLVAALVEAEADAEHIPVEAFDYLAAFEAWLAEPTPFNKARKDEALRRLREG